MNTLLLMSVLIISILIQLNTGLAAISNLEEQTLSPTLQDVGNFNLSADTLFLRDALMEDSPYVPLKIAHIGTMRSRKQRMAASEALRTTYSYDLTNILVRQQFGILADEHFLDLLMALYMPRGFFLAQQIYLAIQRKPNENTLTDILCCIDGDVRTNAIRHAYNMLYPTGVRNDIKLAVAGPYADLLADIIQSDRRRSPDHEYANQIAQSYYSHKDMICTGSYAYWTHFATRSYGEIQLFSNYFANYSNMSFNHFLTKASHQNCSMLPRHLNWLGPVDNFKNLLLAIEEFSSDKGKYFFQLLMKGPEDMDLKRVTRIIALVADYDLGLGEGGRAFLETVIVSKLDEFPQKINHWYRDLVQKILRGNSDPDRDFIWKILWTEYEKP